MATETSCDEMKFESVGEMEVETIKSTYRLRGRNDWNSIYYRLNGNWNSTLRFRVIDRAGGKSVRLVLRLDLTRFRFVLFYFSFLQFSLVKSEKMNQMCVLSNFGPVNTMRTGVMEGTSPFN